MAVKVSLKQLRAIKLPPVKDKEPDHITALRNTLDFHSESPEGTKVYVPDLIADLIVDEKDPDPKVNPNATQS